MKQIEILEKVLAKKIAYNEANVNDTFFVAYKSSTRKYKDLLDFNDVIWDRDVQPIIANCKEFGIEEITISSTFSGLLETLEIFADNGCKIVGLTKVDYIDWDGQDKKIPAMKIQMPK